MKRRLLHLVVALMAFAATTKAQSLSVATIEATPGTETTITVNIAGATEMTALQCNLQLPEGLTLAGDITLGDAAKGHTLSVSTLASGDLLIVLYDLYQSTFTDGTLLTIPVVVAKEPSTTEGTLHKVRTSTIAAQSKTLSDVKFSAVVGEEEQLVGGEFVINGIKYNGDAETQTASVIGVEEGFAQAEVNIPETVNGFTVTTVGDRAFANNKTITSVTLPNSVISIEERAFRGCTNLQSIVLSEQLKSIGGYAFHKDESLSSIVIPNNVTTIGMLAFCGCTNLKSAQLSSSLKEITMSLFQECTNLESVLIPNSVEVIETWAFMYCESLKSITIPSSVVSIIPDGVSEGYLQFSGCSQLESIVVEEGNPVYDSRNNANAIIETSTNTLIIGCNNSTVPEGVERIDDYAFCDFKGLEDVTLPSTLKEIGIMAFANTGLKSIEIPASIESLGENAFNGCESLRKAVLPNTLTSIPASLFIFCRSLEEVNIPNGVESIGDMAFRRSGITSVEIPSSVKTIGEQAFQGCVNMETITIPSSVTSISGRAFQNCDVLHAVVSQIETPFAIESNVFSRVIDGTETPTTATLYVPKGCKELYKSAEGWNQFSTILEEGETPEPSVPSGEYYLYHAESKRFLSRGEHWGTCATVDRYGIPFVWTAEEYSLKFLDSNVHLFETDDSNIYTDNNSTGFSFEEVEGGYLLKSQKSSRYLTIGNAAFTHQIVNVTDDASAAVVWQLKSKAEHDAIVAGYVEENYANVIAAAGLTATAGDFVSYLATLNAEDKTSAIGTARFAGSAGEWTFTEVRHQDWQPAYGTDFCELWQATGSYTQTLNGLAEGIYKVTVQGFERSGGWATCNTLAEKGYEISTATLSANGEETNLKSWYSGKSGESNPNNTGEAVAKFAEGLYQSEVYTYVGEDGTLTLTLCKPSHVGDNWVLFNNFTLTRYAEGDTGLDMTTDNGQPTTVIYDLTGRRIINAENLKGGIYIVNGKKIVIK